MPTRAIGPLLKQWRSHRRLSQLELSAAAGVSQRHLSFVETGRARPSRELVIHLAESLDVPLRDRNVLLHAAGFAPQYQETSLDDPELASVRRAIELTLEHHNPYPAVVVDRHWNLVTSNEGAVRLTTEWAAPEAIEHAQGNLLRLFTHPTGFRRHIANFAEVAAAIGTRLHRELIADPADETLQALVAEVMQQPNMPAAARVPDPAAAPQFVIPVHLRRGELEVRMFSTIATIGSPLDITVQELVIELFFPADAASEAYFHAGPSAGGAASFDEFGGDDVRRL